MSPELKEWLQSVTTEVIPLKASAATLEADYSFILFSLSLLLSCPQLQLCVIKILLASKSKTSELNMPSKEVTNNGHRYSGSHPIKKANSVPHFRPVRGTSAAG